MLKTFLVPMLDADRRSSALATAIALAKRFNGRVAGCLVQRDPRELFGRIGDDMSETVRLDLLRHAVADAGEEAEAARRWFERACTEAEAPGAAGSAGWISGPWRSVMGHADAALAQEGRFADLLVFPEAKTVNSGPWRVALDGALFGSGRPVLLATDPPAGRIGTSVVIAWDGSQAAVRAVNAALPILASATHVRIVTVDAEDRPLAQPERLSDWLAAQGVKAPVVTMAAGSDPAGQVVLETAVDEGADLLVMGGFGHSRFREWVLGGVTRHVLKNAEIPILMMH